MKIGLLKKIDTRPLLLRLPSNRPRTPSPHPIPSVGTWWYSHRCHLAPMTPLVPVSALAACDLCRDHGQRHMVAVATADA